MDHPSHTAVLEPQTPPIAHSSCDAALCSPPLLDGAGFSAVLDGLSPKAPAAESPEPATVACSEAPSGESSVSQSEGISRVVSADCIKCANTSVLHSPATQAEEPQEPQQQQQEGALPEHAQQQAYPQFALEIVMVPCNKRIKEKDGRRAQLLSVDSSGQCSVVSKGAEKSRDKMLAFLQSVSCRVSDPDVLPPTTPSSKTALEQDAVLINVQPEAQEANATPTKHAKTARVKVFAALFAALLLALLAALFAPGGAASHLLH